MNTPRFNTATKGRKGFTLIELMIVITILAILLTLGIPSFRELIAAQRVRTAASAMYESLLIARSEAIKRNQPVSLHPNTGGFSNGWRVMLVDNVTSVRTQEALTNVDFAFFDSSNAAITSPSSTTLSYTGLGRMSNIKTTVTMSATGTSKQWSVIAEGSGRVCVTEAGTSC